MDKCENCGKELHIPNWKRKSRKYRKANKHFFCSIKCYKKWWIETIAVRFRGEGNSRWDKNKVYKKCFVCKKDFRATGKRKIWGKFCSRACSAKWRFTGSKNVNWKGGILREERTELPEYENWRKEVYKKDRWICKICGYKGRQLVAHHIKSFKDFPKLRFIIKNGITLCRSCHCKLHTIHKKVIDFTEILNDYMSDTKR